MKEIPSSLLAILGLLEHGMDRCVVLVNGNAWKNLPSINKGGRARMFLHACLSASSNLFGGFSTEMGYI